ncbi:MAG: hypothetical protein JXB36_09950 [Gammaproteobacteria bacterium]|nr:hypothetical protein [Gammaproteobacteria bacterium]
MIAWQVVLLSLLPGAGISYLLIEEVVERMQQRLGATGDERKGMWMIYVAVAVDLTSDGLMFGTGCAVSFGLALVLAAGQVLADLPSGSPSEGNIVKTPR